MNIHTALTIVDGRPVVSSRTVAEYPENSIKGTRFSVRA